MTAILSQPQCAKGLHGDIVPQTCSGICIISSNFKPICKILNTLRLRQNGCHSADEIFKRISFNENGWIVNKIALKFVPKGPIDNKSSLVQVMAWHQTGAKPLSEPMVSLLTGAYIHVSLSLNKSKLISPLVPHIWVSESGQHWFR